tara:strand:+ start:1160 stop:1720 length:561 start_codon:yes stop_codon:yes gene_type:complete
MAKKALDFGTALKYPFNRPKGLTTIFWIFLPIIGWFALGGYSIRIVKEFLKGKFKQLPLFNFTSDLKFGFFMFIKAIPFMIAYAVVIGLLSLVDPSLRAIGELIIGIFVIPLLVINFFNKETVSSFFEFKILKSMFNNFGDYIITLLKSLLLGLIFFAMWLILVGIPAGAFTKHIFLADFYRRNVK